MNLVSLNLESFSQKEKKTIVVERLPENMPEEIKVLV